MTGPFADRLFRITFALAGLYNLAFGLWAAVWPLAFFQLFDIALTQRGDYPARHFLTASTREAALSALETGYRSFFAHVQRGRITAFSEPAVKRFAV